jgi:hypothetical protein
MTQGPLSADDIRRLFGELASELDKAGQRAEIFLVGGAAIALCFDARRDGWTLTLQSVDRWKAVLDGLAEGMDRVVEAHLRPVYGASPW